jgi:hypothetical protein
MFSDLRKFDMKSYQPRSLRIGWRQWTAESLFKRCSSFDKPRRSQNEEYNYTPATLFPHLQQLDKECTDVPSKSGNMVSLIDCAYPIGILLKSAGKNTSLFFM